jgi:nickel-dependent lactate racemase
MSASPGSRLASLEYGETMIQFAVPESADILAMTHLQALPDPACAIRDALSRPVGAATLSEQVAALGRAGTPASALTVAITVSDNTRPVPYSSDRRDGVLAPLLDTLCGAGIKPASITIVVGTGTHEATSAEWKRAALGRAVVDSYRVVDHDCTSSTLASVGEVDGTDVRVNEHFLAADLRIATSLAEPHFMAGVSGGAKAVCPGLINIEATRVFHSAAWMKNRLATNLSMDGNPCVRFSREVARRVGVHFSVNCLIDRAGNLAGIVAGALEAAHDEAARMVTESARIACAHAYDVVITHAGKVGVNHYQAAKAAYGAIPVVARGGVLVLFARNSDREPIGKPEYRRLMRMLAEHEPGEFSRIISRPEWEFVPDQWQVQKWDQFFESAGGYDRLIYCTTGIPERDLGWLPGRSGYEFLGESRGDQAVRDDAEGMVRCAVSAALGEQTERLGSEPRVAVLTDGPYAVPTLASGRG